MKALVVYESMFGNTERIARAVAGGLGDALEVTLADVADMPPMDGMDLVIMGAPTHAFGLSRPSTRQDAAKQATTRPGATNVGLREYLELSTVPAEIAAAAFDTKINKPFVPGSAAHKVYRRLRQLGCRMLRPAESFRVTGTTGPLVDGEENRAQQWARELADALLSRQHQA